ncbi:MAG: PH domain-containing protein [Clostridia bacterium]|nr:PH domain-containing protein [Clostridia bacterium]
MKRFDKGYIYSNLLSDLVGSIVIFLFFFEEIFFEEEPNMELIVAAIPFFVIALAVIYLCFIAYRIAYYRTSGYELTETEIKCKRGVLFRKNSVLEYKKVHAINKKQSLFHRFFGIAVLTVDSGSTNTSHQAEIVIIEKNETVDALLNELNALKETGGRGTDVKTEAAQVLLSEEDSLYSFTSKRKILYTFITVASLALGIAVFAILTVAVLGVCKLMLQNGFLGTWGEFFIFSALITLGAVLMLSVFSFIGCMVRAFIGYHDFTVTKHGSDLRISFGLLEKHTNTFSYDRIKAVKISQGLLQRMLGFASIHLEVIGYTYETGSDNVTLGVLVPFCKYNEVGEILGKILPEYVPDQKQTKAKAYFPFVSWFSLILGIVTGVTLVLTLGIMWLCGVSATVLAVVAFAVIGLSLIILASELLSAALNYQTSGIAMNGAKITAYRGGFTRGVTVFMVKNLIAVANVTTPLRKKAGIATLVLHLKTNAQTNEVKVPIQEDTLAEKLEELLIL